MGRGKQLSQAEIDHVLQLKEQNYKISQIARSIERSRTVVETLLKDPNNYGFGKKFKKKNTEPTEKDTVISASSIIKDKPSPQKVNNVSSSPVKKQDGKTKKKSPKNVVAKAAQKTKQAIVNGKVTKNKTMKKMNKSKNTIKFKMLFNKKKNGKKSKQL